MLIPSNQHLFDDIFFRYLRLCSKGLMRIVYKLFEMICSPMWNIQNIYYACYRYKQITIKHFCQCSYTSIYGTHNLMFYFSLFCYYSWVCHLSRQNNMSTRGCIWKVLIDLHIYWHQSSKMRKMLKGKRHKKLHFVNGNTFKLAQIGVDKNTIMQHNTYKLASNILFLNPNS